MKLTRELPRCTLSMMSKIKKNSSKRLKKGNGKKLLFQLSAIILSIGLLVLTISLASTRQNTASQAQSTGIVPVVETDAFSGSGDIADDSAIWFNTANPSQSVIIGDNKESGIGVFDLSGKLLQFRSDGRIGNVDIRTDFQLGSETMILVGANNRTTATISLYKLNPTSRQLEPVGGSRNTLNPNYGFCFYKSQQSNKYYAFVTQEAGGTVEQYELSASGVSINAVKVRTLNVGSQSEGCVADDASGQVYIAEEDVGIWKYGAEPTAGTNRTAIDSVGGGHLTADVEGVAIAYGPDGKGYLFASSQGDSKYAVYDLATGSFIKNFSIGANGSIDAVSETDGISVYYGNFNTTFPQGIFVAHDADNSGGSTSNLKYVPLHTILTLGTTSPTVNPTLEPTLITPTSYCLGGCPLSPTVTEEPGISASPTIDPCNTENTNSVTHKKKHRSDSGFIDQFFSFLMRLLELFMRLLGGGGGSPTPNPDPQPTEPLEPTDPSPTINPCI